VRRFEERRGLSKRRTSFKIWEEGDQCYTGMDKEVDRRKEGGGRREEEGGRRKEGEGSSRRAEKRSVPSRNSKLYHLPLLP
jgi:hypothetical protein